MWLPTIAIYVVTVAALTGLVARRKGRDTGAWFVAGVVGGFAVLLLALIAPRAGRPWRSRAFLALGLFAVIALAVVLLVVAISEANLVTP